VADILHVSPKTVSRWAKEGRLPFLKTLGGHRRYPEAEIRELANQLQVQPTTTRAVDPALGSRSLHSGLAG
jgi:excisionase family DNA binding protein